ncbi:MAG TPA: ABC transporter ATP-binding protein [Eubacteriales bacterium]|nr:ABC transporter ATP-binding protein [Clostridia bacterium]HRV73440.1 ABC transporter ATP-binding protein [Eubacteriales bacterium]
MILEINGLTKRYHTMSTPSVDNLTLHVDAGDIFGFIGHNGAGKTTTLRCVTGILAFEQGDILIDGKSIKTEPLECKRITRYIPDNPDLYEHLTGMRYLTFLADIYGLSEEMRFERISHFAKVFEMSDRLGDLIGAMSHGMKQKVAIIGALIQNPRLLVMDEPFVGLDPVASHALKEIMHEMTQNGSAIFFSTHILEVAEKLCNKVAIIKNGKLLASGSMEEVRGNISLEESFLELIEK